MCNDFRWFCDAHWMMIKNGSELDHPHWIISNNEEPDKMALRFAVCNNCKLEFFVPPTFKEYKEMTREARRRVLKSKKNFYIKQYNIGMLSEESYRILVEAVEKGLESPNVQFDTNKFLNMIREVNLISHNSQGFWNTYEYRFRMMHPRHMNRFRRLIMSLVVHPLFDLTINFVALSNLMINIYLLISSSNRPLFFTIYYCFFGVYLFEMIVKIHFFTLRRFYDGIFNYFSSVWNMMDALLVLMTFIVVIYISYRVDYWNVLLVATFSTLRIVRISRLFQHFKTCRSVMSLEARIHGDSRARKAYETGKTFIKGEQELMVIVPGMVKDPHITADILMQMDENIMLVAREIEQIQHNRPQVSIDIKTKQAIRTVLNFMNEEIDFIKNAGWIDEIEYKLLLKSVYERYQYLHTLRKVKRNSPKAFFEDILWLNDDETLTEYLYDNAQNKSFASQDVIIAKGEHADGIYMVISGLLNIEYEPEPSVLEKLERYGALPVIDFMTNMNFKAARREYIVAGNTFGEFSLLTRRPYACSIIADTSCEVMFLPEQCVRSAMNLDNDPVSGMECRIWKNVCRNMTLDILVNARPYRTTPLDEVRQCLDRCFVPKLSQFRALSRTEYIEDIIVIDGAVLDEKTRTYFVAPRHIPRSVQKIFLPGNEKFSLNTEIETKLVLVTIPDAKPEFIMEREKNLNDGSFT
ncbi:sodium/hydrogen exchanger 11-like isoform X2 [Coccinella septempunctata]|uniref:sodium/hydrogen exchanger 11-like isoform X2 n=1 Tax=Coccinella septempunctata TaxID=41139 RepID=UPI001D07AF5D|nr:sodium/hydrogen exchanger 11-like isoform X2 [Coccinella septempunctata]